MSRWITPIRSTMVGGLLFILPLFIIGYVFIKLLGVVVKLAQPLTTMLGITALLGKAAGTVVALVLIALVAYLIGQFAQTALGQKILRWLENGIIATIPQFNVISGLIKSFDTDNSQVDAVLVPTDAGWQLGVVFEKPHGDWYTVFLPGSPEWLSGSISYAHRDNVRPVPMPLLSLMAIMRKRGVGSKTVCEALARYEAAAQSGSTA